MKQIEGPILAWRRAGRLGVLTLGASAQERFDERVDELLRLGHDQPDAALAELRTLEPPPGDIGAQRLLLLARGMVLAQSGRDSEAQGWAGACVRMRARSATPRPRRLPNWSRRLARTTPAAWTWQLGLARGARDGLQPYCPPLSEQAVNGMRSTAVAEPAGLPEAPVRCDHRAAWQRLAPAAAPCHRYRGLGRCHPACALGARPGCGRRRPAAPGLSTGRPGLAHGAQRQHRRRAAAVAAVTAAGAAFRRPARCWRASSWPRPDGQPARRRATVCAAWPRRRCRWRDAPDRHASKPAC